MATLRDVAELAGVSAMTVSNVVNGREGKVSQATLERVREAIATLGYVPNAQARALAGASSRIIALVYGSGAGDAPLAVSHESVFVGACEQACRERGLALMLCAAGPEPVARLVSRLRSWNVEGVIAVGTVPGEVYRALAGMGVPVVAIDSRSLRQAGQDLAAMTVGIDDAGGGRLAGERLREAGHREVIFAAPLPNQVGVDQDRLGGLRSGLGPQGRVWVVQARVDFGDGVRTGLALAGEGADAGAGEAADAGGAGDRAGARGRVARVRRAGRPEGATAVFASGDVLAMGLVAGLRRGGVAVPAEVSVVGFDGFEVSTYCDPVLTTVVQPVQDKAGEAIRLLAGAGAGTAAGGGVGGGGVGADSASGAGRGVPAGSAEVVLPVSWREGGTLGPAA